MYNKFSQEKPDGHTISYFGSTSPISLELTRQNAKYSVEDFSPIGAWNIKSQMLITHTDNWETFSDFLNAAKQKGLSVASSEALEKFNIVLWRRLWGQNLNGSLMQQPTKA